MTKTFQATGTDVLATHAASLNHTPTRCSECGIDVFSPGLGFVHG